MRPGTKYVITLEHVSRSSSIARIFPPPSIKCGAEADTQLQAGQYGNALAAAVYRGNKNIVELLIKAGAHRDSQ